MFLNVLLYVGNECMVGCVETKCGWYNNCRVGVRNTHPPRACEPHSAIIGWDSTKDGIAVPQPRTCI